MFRSLFVLLLLLASGRPAFTDEPATKPRKRPDVGYHPTPQDVVEKMLDLAKVTKSDHVCDLGCGDGRFVVTAAKKYGCRATGYEIDPKLVAQGRARIQDEKLEELARIVDQDIFTVDTANVTVMMLFLLEDLNEKLVPRLQTMARGSRIVTHEFHIPGIKADQELTWVSKIDNSEHLLFVYTVPLKTVPQRSVPLKSEQ